MHVECKGTLARATTKRAKLDKDGMEVESAAIVLSIEVPIIDLTTANIAGILRSIDRRLTVDLYDGQIEFDVAERDGQQELVTEPR